MRVLVRRGSVEAGKQVILDDDEAHHLRVRRARDHESVEILDGAGLRGSGRLVHARRGWLVEVDLVERQDPPPELRLAVGAGDRERFSWLVEKAVEFGVTGVVPLETAHTAGVGTRLRKSQVPRLQRAALEVLKQCGATWSPTIEEPVALESFLERPFRGVGWLADQVGSSPPAVLDSTPVCIIVGPEGGFTDNERETIVDTGYEPMRLGPHTLRFETAAIAAAAASTQARERALYG